MPLAVIPSTHSKPAPRLASQQVRRITIAKASESEILHSVKLDILYILEYIHFMVWKVLFHREFLAEFEELSVPVQNEIAADERVEV